MDSWRHVRDSKEALIRFGSMIQDLECYEDNSLRFDGSGRIVGRNAGLKGWLRENAPELAPHYTPVIRYKAAAKKLQQIVGLSDPIPVAAVLGRKRNVCNHGAEKIEYVKEKRHEIGTGGGVEKDDSPSVEVVRARAIYLEVMEDVPDVAARVMARIDALCAPERMDEVTTLRS